MSRLIHPILLALALTAAPIAIASAQGERLTPEAISDDAPMAKQARALAELLLAGDRPKLEQYLAVNAAPSFKGGATFAADITELVDALKTGARTIIRMDGVGPTRVAAALGAAAGGSPERAIVVSMDSTAPHQITSLRLARIQGG